MKLEDVRIESGGLTGQWNGEGDVCAFKGVPYARPPLGVLRWCPPQPVQRWSGSRPALEFGPRCVQPNRPDNAVGYFGPEDESEDCLYLNVWTGAPSAQEKRPVMVWIHGGGFVLGSGALPIFDGSGLARRGAVVVTMNYRLGRLGFLAHPDLSAEQQHGTSGNYAMLDQLAVLRWVKTNIAAFGGNPDCVTLFGQSAGSSSVNTLMASPLAKGLFRRAIGQSGGAFFGRILARLPTAERAGEEFACALGAQTIGDLREMPVRDIQFRRPDEGNIIKDVYDSSDPKGIDRKNGWSIIDGYVLPRTVMEEFTQARQNDVPLLTGSTADEGSTQPPIPTLDEYMRRAQADYGEMAGDFLRVYPAGSDADALQSSRKMIGNRIFNWENWTWANLQAQTGSSPVYFYHFGHVPPKPSQPGRGGDLEAPIGSFHTADIPYVFQTLDVRNWPWRDIDRELADTMAQYWVNFASSGNPNGAGLPEWPRYNPARDTTLLFKDGVRVGATPDRPALEFWKALDAKLRQEAR
jgi:para-nitrobenzyl esterase